MKQSVIDSFSPNKNLDGKSRNTILIIWISVTLSIWFFSGSKLLPTPLEILEALKDLIVKKGFIRELMTSTMFCLHSMLYACVISLLFSYLSVIPFFRAFVAFIAKSRFLSTAGLTFLIGEITPDSETKKLVMLVFAITVFLVTSMLSVVIETTKDELDYARTLRMNEWQSVWEVIIRGKIDKMFEVIRQNFAIAWMMLAMVESLCRSSGGVGVLLADTDKHFKLEAVFAIQLVILLVGIFFDWLLKKFREWLFPYSTIKLERK